MRLIRRMKLIVYIVYTRQGAKQAHSQAVRERENPVKSGLQRPLPSPHVILVYKIEVEVRSWEAMPPVSEQLALAGSQTNSALVAARFLLSPGRTYEGAVKTFQPYDRTREVNEEARKAGAALITDGLKAAGRRTFVYVNNRLEGNALSTIEAMVAMVGMAA